MMDIASITDSVVFKKTTWGVESLIAELTKAYSQAKIEPADSLIYTGEGGVLDSFRAYTTENSITSIGRNQFFTWLNTEIARQFARASIASAKPRTTVVPKRRVMVTGSPGADPQVGRDLIHNAVQSMSISCGIPTDDDVPWSNEPQPMLGVQAYAELAEKPEDEVTRLRREVAELRGTLGALQNQFLKVEPVLKAFTSLLKGFDPQAYK